MQELYNLIGSISATPNHAPLPNVGESGTGNERVARPIHADAASAAG